MDIVITQPKWFRRKFFVRLVPVALVAISSSLLVDGCRSAASVASKRSDSTRKVTNISRRNILNPRAIYNNIRGGTDDVPTQDFGDAKFGPGALNASDLERRRRQAELDHEFERLERMKQYEHQRQMYQGRGVPAGAEEIFGAQEQQQQDGAPPPPELSPTVAKLLQTVQSSGAVTFMMFILVWRGISHYEIADKISGPLRIPAVMIAFLVCITNLAGFVVSMSGSNNKTRLKIVINNNKVVEFVELVFNAWVLLFQPNANKNVREESLVKTFTNVFFLMQLQLYTKATWGVNRLSEQEMSSFENDNIPSGYYDEGIYQEESWSSSQQKGGQQY